MVKGSNPIKGIVGSSKKEFSIIIETAVRLVVSYMTWDSIVGSSNSIIIETAVRLMVSHIMAWEGIVGSSKKEFFYCN